jgi:CcmD family protein
LSFLFTALHSFAQSAGAPTMDTALQKNGKIYVVVAVLVIIFIGIVLFLLRLERRISKLEKRDPLS